MSVSIAHPQPRGRRRRAPLLPDVTPESGPTPLEKLIAEANSKRARTKRAPRKTAKSDVASGSVIETDALAADISEAGFVGAIVEEMRRAGGWSVDCKRQGIDALHVPKGVAMADWREIGDGSPDLWGLHEERPLLLLLETKKNKKGSALREKQVRWKSGLQLIASISPCIVYRVVTPADWAWIKAIIWGRVDR